MAEHWAPQTAESKAKRWAAWTDGRWVAQTVKHLADCWVAWKAELRENPRAEMSARHSAASSARLRVALWAERTAVTKESSSADHLDYLTAAKKVSCWVRSSGDSRVVR